METESLIDELKRCSVSIMDSRNNIAGAGTIVTDELIATCYHVVESIANKPDKSVNVFFTDSNIAISSKVLKEYSNESLDIAFLKLNRRLPKVANIAPLSETVTFGHDFIRLKFNEEFKFGSLVSLGKVYGQTIYTNENGQGSPIIQLYSDELGEGVSGSPILDLQTNTVIGINDAAYEFKTSSDMDHNLSFAIPIETITQVCPIIKERNSKLLPVSKFLRKLGITQSIDYEKIDELYVPPIEYDEIRETLEKKRIVFIIGPPEFGKTYTAVYLLWQYFKKGYEPLIKLFERNHRRSDARGNAVKLGKYLKAHQVVCFEDPFGKTEYEDSLDLERYIGRIINIVESIYDGYVIITSREELFKEFLRRIIPEVELSKYIVNLGVKTPSYDYERRKEILLRWAVVTNCEWLRDDEARNYVLELIKDETKLSTPYNIREFAVTTKTITNQQELLVKMNKFLTTSRYFAQEVKEMSQDKVLFLLFPYISDQFTLNFVINKFRELVKIIGIQDNACEFNVILDGFIGIIQVRNGFIRFSHPSFFDGVKYALSEDYQTNIVRLTLAEILLNLSVTKETFIIAAKAIVSNYDILPQNIRDIVLLNPEIILELADNEEYSLEVMKAIVSNSDKVPDSVWDILYELADEKGISLTIANALASHFDNVPSYRSNNLLIKLATYEQAYLTVARTIVSNYDKVPETVRNILFELADEKGISLTIANALDSNFDKLPSDMRNSLMIKLANYKPAVPTIVRTIISNYDKVPERVKKILFDLADNKENTIILSKTIVSNYDKVPHRVRGILFKLRKNKDISDYILRSLIYDNAKNPRKTIEELLKGHTDNQ